MDVHFFKCRNVLIYSTQFLVQLLFITKQLLQLFCCKLISYQRLLSGWVILWVALINNNLCQKATFLKQKWKKSLLRHKLLARLIILGTSYKPVCHSLWIQLGNFKKVKCNIFSSYIDNDPSSISKESFLCALGTLFFFSLAATLKT